MANKIVPYKESVAKRRVAFYLWLRTTRFLLNGFFTQVYTIWYSYRFVRHTITALGALCCSFALFSASQRPDVSLAQMPDIQYYDTLYTYQPDGVVDVELHPKDNDLETFGPIAEERGKTVENYDETVKAYIKRFAPVAQADMRIYGVPASISLAQGIIESRAGTSRLARSNNNHFGMKCFSRNCRKGHCSNFTDDSHKDFFRIYPNAWESWRAHSIMLSSGRYATLKKYGRDYRKWAYGLKRLGYATNGTYAEKIISVIARYDLKRFDH